MNISELKDGILLSNLNEFNIEKTFSCGQCFRWDKISDNTFSGIAFGKKLVISQQQNQIFFKNISISEFYDVWYNYFDLGRDYGKIRENLSYKDATLRKAATYSKGIRILKQDKWESLCSFIISQNNNIPRIKGIISRLCEKFGEKLEHNTFSFPSVKVISELQESDLEPIRAGFRSKYIIDAAKKVYSGEIDFEKINKLTLNDAEACLKLIKGVGPKVAQCTLLYGFNMLEAFPVDVWIKRAMHSLFPKKDQTLFAPYAGVAQQYIFFYMRSLNA